MYVVLYSEALVLRPGIVAMPARQKIESSIILYIEDDEITRKNFSQFLKSQCKMLYTASDGLEGFELYKKHEPDIVITDIEMPVLSGLEMARKIREISSSTQIIIISAYKKPQYLLDAVNLQLVQYLIKPISLEKITQVLEFASQFLRSKKTSTRIVINGKVFYDIYTKQLVVNNKIISLSKYERALIELLIKKYPAPVPYEFIEASIYDYGASKNAIKLLVSSLREKVEKQTIANVSGFGYKLNLLDDR